MTSIYDKISNERKKMQAEGTIPEWWSTGGWQLFKDKYLYQAENPKQQYLRIASTLAAHTPDPNKWKDTFFDLMWKGWLSPATPILSNTGTDRGLPVSCAGSYMGDSIYEIYEGKKEIAMLTKMGFGTASYLGDIRPRGSVISDGGKSMGVMPIIQGMHSDMDYVSQGVSRRGSWAGYLPIDHGDFNEVCTYLEQNPDGNNIGWNISNAFIERLNSGDEEAIGRYAKAMKTKMLTGKGYFWFTDKANDNRPECYKANNLDIKAAQLCVHGTTELLTNKGNLPIQDIEGQEVTIWNGEEWSDVLVQKTGVNQEMIKVTLLNYENGSYKGTVVIEATPYHKWYDKDGKELRTFQLEEDLCLESWKNPRGSLCRTFVKSLEVAAKADTYCVNEPIRHKAVFNNVLTGNCNEISLHSSEEYSYTCVLASMNLEKFDEWKNTDAVFNSTVFLDSVCQEFIERAKNIKGLEKAVAFTKRSRALGLGVTGFCSYLYKNMIPYESAEAAKFNHKAFKLLKEESTRASQWLAETWGEPEWCKGFGVANSHRIAVAPTKSTALIMGGLSEGINPDTAMVFTQRSAGGEIDRMNIHLLALMKEKGVYSTKNVEEVRDAMGSVQGVDWLTEEEKNVFKTAFEIDQRTVLRYASNRAKHIDQWQSLNLFFAGDDEESYVNEVHRTAFQDPNILGLYYVYSKAGVQASRDECVACQ